MLNFSLNNLKTMFNEHKHRIEEPLSNPDFSDEVEIGEKEISIERCLESQNNKVSISENNNDYTFSNV